MWISGFRRPHQDLGLILLAIRPLLETLNRGCPVTPRVIRGNPRRSRGTLVTVHGVLQEVIFFIFKTLDARSPLGVVEGIYDVPVGLGRAEAADHGGEVFETRVFMLEA